MAKFKVFKILGKQVCILLMRVDTFSTILFSVRNQFRIRVPGELIWFTKIVNFHRFRHNFERSLDADNTLGYKSSWTHSHNCNNRPYVRIPRLRYRILCLGVGLFKVEK